MAAVYPSSVKVFTTKVDLVDTVLAENVNTLQDEVTAVQTSLGSGILSSTWAGGYTNPTTHASVQARMANIEAGLISLGSGKQDAATAVTLTGTQTLTNKTLTSPAISGGTLTSTLTNSGTISGGTINATTLQVGGVAAVTVSGTQTLTNKTLTSPVISQISNTGTLTLPTITDTLVGRATTDTLTNKTLTSPTISGATLSGTLTSTATLSGGTVNPTTLQQGGVAVVTVSGAQTLTDKTLTAPVISTISNTGTLTLPTSTDTLVGRSTTDTLTNKTLTAPVISTISNIGTLTLPTSTDTLVGRATTDVLTNKTLTNAYIIAPEEKWNISATAAGATTILDFLTAQNWYYTTASTAGACTLNVRGNSGTTINSLLEVGDSVTVSFMVTTGASTPGYFSTVQVDGTASGVSTRWMYGSAPTAGSASAVDAYSFTIIKTAATPAYTVFASVAKN
jgi:hypothetical protein